MKTKVYTLLLVSSLLIYIGCSKPADEAKAPSAGLTYSVTSAVYTKDGAILPNTPSVNGTGFTYTVSPALPNGLTLNPGTGVITGTPTAVQTSTSYTVTAANSSSSFSATISIIINYSRPTRLSYLLSSAIYTKDGEILTNTPTVNGSGITFSISPNLPAGLSLNPTSGDITGTPTIVRFSTNYTVTATNSGGSISTTISITINNTAPTSLTYPVSSAVYTRDGAILSNTPTVNGSGLAFSVIPSLPDGLSLNTTTGTITGIPTSVQTTTNYTVTATNSGGSISTTISIIINNAAPTALSYSKTVAVYTRDGAILPNTPTVNGSGLAFSVSPGLPAGLTLNTATGVITGTPTSTQSAASYTVTATNSSGSISTSLSITINNAAPTAFAYPATSAVYTVAGTILPFSPTVSGSGIIYSVSPSLPDGLILNPTTGAITGTPTSAQSSISYTVTATNSGGYRSTSISITINYDAPAGFSYSDSSAGYATDTQITPNNPTKAGSGITFTVSPALPSGLVLNSVTGIISGTPTTQQQKVPYTITASNSGGSASAIVSITIFNKNRTFKSVKVTDNSFYDVPSTLMGIGKYCVVYVENAQSAKCNAATASAICNEFDNNIYNKIKTNFGNESDVDSNGRIIIFLLDIIDGYTGSGGYVAGFFNPINEFAIGTQPNSNEADMLFMDVNPLVPASTAFYSTVAHEFQHLVNFNTTYFDDATEQDVWINEGLSSAAEYVYAGAQIQSKITYYNTDPLSTIRYGNNFFVWNGYWENRATNPDMLANYSTVYLFFQWLRIHSSNDSGIYKEILSPLSGMKYRDYRAVTEAASNRISSSFGTWSTLIRTWYEANLLIKSNGYQGYKSLIGLNTRYFSNTGGASNLFSPGEGVFTIAGATPFTPAADSGANIVYVGINSTTGAEDLDSPYSGNVVLTYNSNTNNSGSDEKGYLPNIVNPNYDFGSFHSMAYTEQLPAIYPIDVNFNSEGKLKPESHRPNSNGTEYDNNKFSNPRTKR